METADIIIIGAGVIGCSIAYHLAKMGCRRVLILEKGLVGSGSTGRCAGGIRQQFSTEANIRLSVESVRFFENFEDETGHPADFRQNGYLMLATTEKSLSVLCQAARLQVSLGVKVLVLSPQEVREKIPVLNVEDVLGATYSPTDGYADPYSVVQGFACAAKRLGVNVREGTEVTGITLAGGTWRVATPKGEFQCASVVIAAGAWSGQIGRMAGVNLPIRPSRRHIFVTEPLQRIARDSPMVVDFSNGFWFRREGPCLIFGMRNPDEPESFDTRVDWGFLPTLAQVACHRLPFLANIGVGRGQAGLHEDTPDANGIIGQAPGLEGLYLACGFSGHGFMHSPAVGRIVAELILAGSSPPELSAFAPERFEAEPRQKESCFI